MKYRWIEFALPVAILASIVVIYIPLPSGLVDILLAANLGIAVVLLLTAIFVRSPLEFSAFPALLLILTLGRLALNVATTRLILTRGPIDQELAAGHVIRGFAEFVAGDQIVVGLIIFAILFVVQFLVITKGATRIGEVAARFSLDGLPGRQMAIDADLNAGLITLEQAQQRRRELIRYSDFHGAMDGASKYVRGDAIAGLIITAVNICGGLALGLYYKMGLEESARTFTLLTIGDGLVTQLPALLISIAAGLLVSRGTHECDLPRESVGQLFNRSIVLWLTAGFLALLATTNLPTIPLLCLAIGIAAVGFAVRRGERAASPSSTAPASIGPPREITLDKLLARDVLELHLGAGLVVLADARQRSNLLAEVNAIRQRVAAELGLVLPKVRIRDNLRLPTRVFQFLLYGETVMRGEAHPDRVLVHGPIPPQPTSIPSDLPWAPHSAWILESESESLSTGQVLTATQAITESLFWVVRKHAAELLSRDATAELLEEVRKHHPAIVRELTDQQIPLARLQRILARLVREGISIGHLARIVEVIVDLAPSETDEAIAERLRIVLKRQTSQRLRNGLGVIRAMGLADEVAEAFSRQNESFGSHAGGLSVEAQQMFLNAIESGIRHMQRAGMLPVLVVPTPIRARVANMLTRFLGELYVIGSEEPDLETTVQYIARITPEDIGLSLGQAA